jgi:hypothetical protein
LREHSLRDGRGRGDGAVLLTQRAWCLLTPGTNDGGQVG